jgi:hypothetical protein
MPACNCCTMQKLMTAALCAAAAALVLSISACAGDATNAGAPTPSAIGTPTSTPTADPKEAPTALSEIRMSAEGITLVNNSGTPIGMIRATDAPAASVALLTESLGFEPVTSSGGQKGSWGIATRYRWDGLVLQSRQNPDNLKEYATSVNFVASTSGTVRLIGPGGVAIGDTVKSLPAKIAVGSYEGTENLPRYLLGDPTPIDRNQDFTEEYYVEAIEDSTSGSVIELWTPASSTFPGYTADLITS